MSARPADAAKLPVSVVAVSYNTYFFTRLLVEKVVEMTTDREFEIVIVDRGSTDGTLEWLAGRGGVRSFHCPQRARGHHHAGAAAVGIRNARHPVIVLMDSDAHPYRNDWLRFTVDQLGDSVRLAGPVAHAGHVGNPFGYYVHPHYMAFWRSDFGDLIILDKVRGETTDTGEEATIRILERGLGIAGLPIENCPLLRADHPDTRYAEFSFGHPHFPTISGGVFHAWYGTRIGQEPQGVVAESAGRISASTYQAPLVQKLRALYHLDYE